MVIMLGCNFRLYVCTYIQNITENNSSIKQYLNIQKDQQVLSCFNFNYPQLNVFSKATAKQIGNQHYGKYGG